MNKIVIPGQIHDKTYSHLFQDCGEHFVFFLCSIVENGNDVTFLVKDVELIQDEDVSLNGFSLEVKTSCLIRVMNEANRRDLALIEGHNHPPVFGHGFSYTDELGFSEFVPYVLDVLGRPYGATAWDGISVAAQYWKPGSKKTVAIDEIRILSDKIESLWNLEESTDEDSIRASRQILALGRNGQERLRSLRVGLVGLGGLGSQVAQQLVYLGIRDFVLVDSDVVGAENLNRIVGCVPRDVGTEKVLVAERMIRSVSGEEEISVVSVAEDLRSELALSKLIQCDVIFGCVDRDGPRLILNELSCSYLIPYVDSAFGITVEGGEIKEAGGRVVTVMPDGPCLLCCKEIDVSEASYDLASSTERECAEQRGYVSGAEVPAPSIVSLDGVIASLAVTELLSLFTGLRKPIQYTCYDFLKNKLYHVRNKKMEKCIHNMYRESKDSEIFRYTLSVEENNGVGEYVR